MATFGVPQNLDFHEDAIYRGRAFWGDTMDGASINTDAFAKATQGKFIKSEMDMLPLTTPVPDDIIWKAIFDYGTAGMDQKAYAEETLSLKEELTKGFEAEFEQMFGVLDEPIAKATTAGTVTASSSSSTGESLIHAIADQKVAMLYKNAYPIQALIPTEACLGKAAVWDAIGPYDFGSANFGTEDQSFTESDITAYTRTEPISYMYSVGRVTKASMYAGRAAVPARDTMAIRVDMAQDALRALRERAMLGVTVDVTDKTPTFNSTKPTNGYYGMYNFLANNSTDYNYVDGTGVTTYDEIMEKLDESFNKMVIDNMSPNIAICDYTTFGVIRRGLTEYFRTEPVQTFTQGVSKINLVFPNEDGLALVPHRFMPQASGSGAIFLMDTRLLARRSLWMDTYEDLAKINLSQKFVVSAAETFIDKSDVDGSTTLMGGVLNLN